MNEDLILLVRSGDGMRPVAIVCRYYQSGIY